MHLPAPLRPELKQAKFRFAVFVTTMSSWLRWKVTTKGLQVDYIVLKVASPRSLQRNLSRSKTHRLPGPTAFALINFPVTDNAEDELVDYLEARLADASFSSAKKDMVLTFETVDDADAGRLFFNELKLETSTLAFDEFINICVEGKPWEVELGDNLQMDAFSPKRDYDRLSTPFNSEVSGTDSKKIKRERGTAVAGDFAGGSHDALMINAKMERSEHISLTAGPILFTASAPPPSTFTPLTLTLPLSDALRPGPPGSQSNDLFDALDLDTAPAGAPIEISFRFSILPHPDVRNKFSECYRVLAENTWHTSTALHGI